MGGALRLTPICEAEKGRRPSPRGVLDGGDDDVGPSNRLGTAALNRDRVRVMMICSSSLGILLKSLDATSTRLERRQTRLFGDRCPTGIAV